MKKVFSCLQTIDVTAFQSPGRVILFIILLIGARFGLEVQAGDGALRTDFLAVAHHASFYLAAASLLFTNPSDQHLFLAINT